MTPTQRAAMQAALDDLVLLGRMANIDHTERQAVKALRAALAEPVVEPVGYINHGIEYHTKGKTVFHKEPSKNLETRWWTADIPVFTSPQQPVEPVVDSVAWQPIATVPKGRIVLVHYKNRLGNGRTMRARYYLPETLESDTTESGWADEGWYEESEAYEYLMPLDDDPTHWMPMPSAPDAAPQTRQPADVPLLTDDEFERLNREFQLSQDGVRQFGCAIEAIDCGQINRMFMGRRK